MVRQPDDEAVADAAGLLADADTDGDTEPPADADDATDATDDADGDALLGAALGRNVPAADAECTGTSRFSAVPLLAKSSET